MMTLFFIIPILSLAIATILHAIMKHDLDQKFNDRYSHKLGSFCFLCVAFWIGALFTLVIVNKYGLDIYEIIICILAIPSLTMLIIKPYFK